MVIDFGFQSMDQLFDLLSESRHSLSTQDFGVEDGSDALYRVVEIVVDDDVLVFLDCAQLPQR
jgi:hypothetical protein